MLSLEHAGGSLSSRHAFFTLRLAAMGQEWGMEPEWMIS
jgi:hypothetical protein